MMGRSKEDRDGYFCQLIFVCPYYDFIPLYLFPFVGSRAHRFLPRFHSREFLVCSIFSCHPAGASCSCVSFRVPNPLLLSSCASLSVSWPL